MIIYLQQHSSCPPQMPIKRVIIVHNLAPSVWCGNVLPEVRPSENLLEQRTVFIIQSDSFNSRFALTAAVHAKYPCSVFSCFALR